MSFDATAPNTSLRVSIICKPLHWIFDACVQVSYTSVIEQVYVYIHTTTFTNVWIYWFRTIAKYSDKFAPISADRSLITKAYIQNNNAFVAACLSVQNFLVGKL